MSNNIRRPIFSGVLAIDAIWFDAALIGEAEARRRVLARWQLGARLHAAGGGYVLTLASPVHQDCATLDGLALCRTGAILASAPLEADERSRVAYGGCAIVRGAQLHFYALAESEQVDAAAWVDVSAIAIRVPLAFPTSSPRSKLGAPEQHKPLRAILEDKIGLPSPEREAFLQGLSSGKGPSTGGGLAGALGMGAMAGAGLLAMLLQKLLKGLEGGGGRGAGDGAGSGTGAGTGGAGTSGTAPPAPLPAWKMRLYALAASLSNASGLAKVMGWQQANYLRNMIDMFERGDVAEALRHAIPIDGIPGSERQALGNLQARSTLDITPQGGTVSTIGLDGETQNYLRQSYRKLFQRLEREGRIDEATFVLAELLHCGAEACDFLERHKRHEQAAQLAETLALTPQLRIRLWLLAGDTERALRIARLHRSYADTVRELERTQHAAAPALRMMWATYLAERGDLIEAAEALWPLEAMRAGALEWLLEAERTGRTLGARALVRKLSLLPESLADSAAAIGALLAADGDEGVLLRATLARELIAIEQHSSATRRLAGAALPYVLAERISGHNQLAKRELNKLVELVGPGLLKADLPNISVDHAAAGRPLSALQSPLQAHGSQAGLLPIHDARRLPDGHYLLALGERGVTRVTAQGKIVVHFPLPAYHLVLSQNGERALALARRGAVVRVSRIDLTSCKVSDWLSHAFDAWSDRFDGAVWNAVIDNRVVAIDTTKEGLSVIWQVAELPGTVIGFQENDHYQVILMKKDDQLHQWRYALPGRRMMQRDLVAALPLHTGVLAQPGFPAPLQLSLGEQGPDSKTATFTRVAGTSFTTALGSYEHVTHAEARDDWVLLHTYDNDEHYRCLVLNSSGSKVVAQLMLDDANGPAASANDDHLLLFDRSGRLLDVDCATGAVHALTLS